MQGNIIGYDLNPKYCQISYMTENMEEPDSNEPEEDSQIPLVIGYKGEVWYYGKDAKRLATISDGYTAQDLLNAASERKQFVLDGKKFEAVWLLTKFIKLSLAPYKQIEFLTFAMPEINMENVSMMKGIASHLGIARDNVYIQDYKESFCHYMFYQPKELWQYEAALFYCDKQGIRSFMLRRLKTEYEELPTEFVTVDEVASANIEELKAIYPVVEENAAKEADEAFKKFIKSIFDKKIVSSVFLTGDGFTGEWFPESLKVLCNGRRAFMGNNLYSKGACYTSLRKFMGSDAETTYLDETKMTEKISVKVRQNDVEEWYPLVPWGTHWYEADGKWEFLMKKPEKIEFQVESLVSQKVKDVSFELEDFVMEDEYSTRLQLSLYLVDEKTCKLVFRDMGLGELVPASNYKAEYTIKLGGSNGQFNSMS